jgi:hypothetical protein
MLNNKPKVAPSMIEMNPVLAAEVWSDNFDDEDVSDWELFTVNHTANPDSLLPANVTVEGGVLRLVGIEWAYAGYNSSVAYGTWTFDLDIQDPVDEYHFSVIFASEVFNDEWLTEGSLGEAYGLVFYTHDGQEDRIRLARLSHDEGHFTFNQYLIDNLEGWKHFVITRSLSGIFAVYMDGVLILDGINTYHTTSERFYICGHGGPAIDNITVYDDIIIDEAPPVWQQSPTTQVIAYGDSFYYDLDATDYSGVDQYWVNDTLNFAIDSDGVITNIATLVAGEYGLAVSVNDTLGYTKTSEFLLIVRPGTVEPVPVDFLLIAVGAMAVVVVVILVWRFKK